MFQALHRDENYTIQLPLPIDLCFALFTPEGERDWVPDWEPLILHPRDGTMQEGMVFMTVHGEEKTYWCLVDHDERAGRLRYTRLTPGSRSVIVELCLSAFDDRTTSVNVRYSYTGLTPEGNAAIEASAGPAFAAMIDGWRTAIIKAIAA